MLGFFGKSVNLFLGSNQSSRSEDKLFLHVRERCEHFGHRKNSPSFYHRRKRPPHRRHHPLRRFALYFSTRVKNTKKKEEGKDLDLVKYEI
jgi:hypothetical protein